LIPPKLAIAQLLNNGSLQISFTNNPGVTNFTVLTSTNITIPLTNWTVLGVASNSGPGQFQFTAPPSSADKTRFYSVRSP